jgi:hypothetical protein
MTFGHEGTGQIWIRTACPTKLAALEIGEELRIGSFGLSPFQNRVANRLFFLDLIRWLKKN